MKSRLLSLAALLMAGAASGALAQGQPQNPPTIENGGPMYNAGQQAKARQAQAQAQAQPAQQQPPEHGPHRPPQAPQPPLAGAPPPAQPARQPLPNAGRPDNGRPPAGGGDRQYYERGGPGRPAPGQQAPGSSGPDHRDRSRYDGDHRDHRDGEPRDWDRSGPDRGSDWDRYDRGPPPSVRRWAPRRYPPVYNSPSRYQGAYWRPPEGFYVRSWRYGEVLPRGWYSPDYQLFDWWSFGLPEPPPGYDWVRVGRDALLVDYSGRIFQVVRSVFW